MASAVDAHQPVSPVGNVLVPRRTRYESDEASVRFRTAHPFAKSNETISNQLNRISDKSARISIDDHEYDDLMNDTLIMCSFVRNCRMFSLPYAL